MNDHIEFFQYSTVSSVEDPEKQTFVAEFKSLQDAAGKCEEAHGFREGVPNFGEKLALMHAELSEALEYFRKGDGPSDHIPEFSGVEEEFADVIIRMMSWADYKHLRVAEAVVAKMAFNESRPYRHGGKKF